MGPLRSGVDALSSEKNLDITFGFLFHMQTSIA